MIFRLTQKLATKLNLEKLPRTDTLDQGSVWYGNLFRVGGVQYMILTESTTLYSFLFHGKGIVDGQALTHTAKKLIEAKFKEKGWMSILGSTISFDQSEPTFLAAQDRRVLSSQNDMVKILKAQIGDQMDYDFVLVHLNIILHTINGVMDSSETRVERLVQQSTKL
jgi:hypothetical protein